MRTKLVVAIYSLMLSALGSISAEENRAAIYDADPDHLWNRMHRAFFERPDSDLTVPELDSVDPPLWRDSSHLRSGPGHRAAIAVLDEFLADDGNAESDPLRRAVMQHDLWSVFDWSARCYSVDAVAATNLETLQSRLADAIGKLALDGEEIASLPNNLDAAFAGGAFAKEFDLEKPEVPFLPRDLFDPDGSWVCVRGVMDGPSAPVHTRYYHGRSPFLVFVKLPGGREATLRYLDELNEETKQVETDGDTGLPQFPVGTAVALVRQMTLIDDTGSIRMTPLTQTLQMRVYREVGEEVTDHDKSQQMIKFRLGRARLFAGVNGGLEPIGGAAPLRVSLLNREDVYESEGARAQGRFEKVMVSCILCHSCGGGTPHGIFTYKQDDWVLGAQLLAPNSLRLTATDPRSESNRTVGWKTKRTEWELLRGLLERDAQGQLAGSAAAR